MNKNYFQQKQPSCLADSSSAASSETDHSPLTTYHSLKHKPAFTLAETLITLGIIGVVAALTIPNFVQSYKRHLVETRLQKFYSVMNQAVKLSEAEYGEFQNWDLPTTNNDYKSMNAWWNTYFAPHVKTLKTEKSSTSNAFIAYLADGTKLELFVWGSVHLYFYPNVSKNSGMGISHFTFFINKNTNKNSAVVEPYKFSWNGDIEELKYGWYGCYRTDHSNARHYCTALIEANGWKIPKDYPFRF